MKITIAQINSNKGIVEVLKVTWSDPINVKDSWMLMLVMNHPDHSNAQLLGVVLRGSTTIGHK